MTAPPPWRVVAASVTGTAHRFNAQGGQDRFGVGEIRQCNGEPVLVAAVSDGAGSAPRSAEGAATAVDAFRDSVFAYLQHRDLARAGDAEIRDWLMAARAAVLNRASAEGEPARAYACTLLGAVIGSSHTLFVQIGDGVIGFKISRDGHWHTPIGPQRGEYRNETFFITDDDALVKAAHFRIQKSVALLVLSTDGLEDLYMDRATSALYAPFFDALFSTIRCAGPQASEDELAQALERYLDSDAVNELTGDDKTLILACRPLR